MNVASLPFFPILKSAALYVTIAAMKGIHLVRQRHTSNDCCPINLTLTNATHIGCRLSFTEYLSPSPYISPRGVMWVILEPCHCNINVCACAHPLGLRSGVLEGSWLISPSIGDKQAALRYETHPWELLSLFFLFFKDADAKQTHVVGMRRTRCGCAPPSQERAADAARGEKGEEQNVSSWTLVTFVLPKHLFDILVCVCWFGRVGGASGAHPVGKINPLPTLAV